MNLHDDNLLERTLQKLSPARVPTDLLEKLVELRTPRSQHASCAAQPQWLQNLCSVWTRWLGPVTAAAMVLMACLYFPVFSSHRSSSVADQGASLRADDLEINQDLVASYEAVATLPTGEPVRLRLNQWEDGILLRNSRAGIEIERRSPRLEVTHVRFDTY